MAATTVSTGFHLVFLRRTGVTQLTLLHHLPKRYRPTGSILLRRFKNQSCCIVYIQWLISGDVLCSFRSPFGRWFSIINTNDVTFTVAYNTTLSQFVGTLAYDGYTAKIDLGETFSVNAITATFDGNSSFVGHVNDIQLKVTTVPEPTTATLSLLALAGLASRRRRK